MATRMLQRRGTAAEWSAANPVLSEGEIGFETDTKIIKIGDGVTVWNDLNMAWLPVSGGTMSGALILQPPAFDNHAARKVDVDAVAETVPDKSVESLLNANGIQNNASDTTSSTAYGNLDTSSGPSITVETGNKALVLITAAMGNSGSALSICSFEVEETQTNTTTYPADDNRSMTIRGDIEQRTYMVFLDGLVPGSNAFNLKYRVSNGVGTFLRRGISVIPIG